MFRPKQRLPRSAFANCDPDVIDYIIPGNDDAIRAIKLFVTAFSEACQEGEAQMKDGAAVINDGLTQLTPYMRPFVQFAL